MLFARDRFRLRGAATGQAGGLSSDHGRRALEASAVVLRIPAHVDSAYANAASLAFAPAWGGRLGSNGKTGRFSSGFGLSQPRTVEAGLS